MSYIGTEPKDIRSFGRTKFDYTATQGQTAFTGADDDGKVLAFTVGQIEVYVNGILMDDSDFTTTGTGTVTLASAANLNDVINIVSFESNIPDNDYVPATGGTFTGAVTHTGAFTSQGIDDNANATAMTIDSSENLLVSKTSAGAATAGFETRPSGYTAITRDGGQPLEVRRLTSDGQLVDFRKDSTSVGSIGVEFTDNLFIGGNSSHCTLGFGTSAIYPTDGNSGGSDADTDLGSSANRFKDLYLSGGAYIGGTGASNKLDDYEEGTFTPSVNHGSIGSSSFGRYTKIGNQVTVFVQVDSGSNTSTASEIFITGLPFTPISPNTTGHAGNGAVSYTSNMPNVISAVAVSSNTYVFFSQTDSTNLTFAETTGTWAIRFTISFNVA